MLQKDSLPVFWHIPIPRHKQRRARAVVARVHSGGGVRAGGNLGCERDGADDIFFENQLVPLFVPPLQGITPDIPPRNSNRFVAQELKGPRRPVGDIKPPGIASKPVKRAHPFSLIGSAQGIDLVPSRKDVGPISQKGQDTDTVTLVCVCNTDSCRCTG